MSGHDRVWLPSEAVNPEEVYTRGWIETDREMGSRKHVRLPGWMRLIPGFVLLCDWCLLCYTFDGMVSAASSSPAWDLAAGVSLATVAMASMYGCLVTAGQRLRAYKGHNGMVSIREADVKTLRLVFSSILGLAILGAVTFITMRSLVGMLIALLLSTLVFTANCLLIGICAHDGSNELHRLNKLARGHDNGESESSPAGPVAEGAPVVPHVGCQRR